MRPINVPAGSPRQYTAKYIQFKGVDMSTDPTRIDESRSPYAPNLISDSGGYPEKRPGWRTLHQLTGPIHGIYRGMVNKAEVVLVHAADKIYRWTIGGDTAPTLLRSGVHNGRGACFCLAGKMWLLTGAEYLVYDGTSLKAASELAAVPLTSSGRNPDGTEGGSYEPVNLLTPKRKNGFVADGTAKVYQLDVIGLDSMAVTAVVNDKSIAEGNGLTVDRTTGKVTFSTAPAKPAVDGADNVIITFAKTVAGYADRIGKCTLAALYGVGRNDRVFLSGNPDYPATDWWCWFENPAYFPDNNYADIGPQSSRIMGYSRIGAYLAIHKEDNEQDSTIYLRSANSLAGNTADTSEQIAAEQVAFPTVQGVAGVGAVAAGAFAQLLDEPLFLARTGVYALTSSTITAERTAQNRSYFIDAALTKEPDLASAVAVQWNGYYLLAVGGRCYVLDGKQNKAYQPQSGGSYVYECYYWENVPAVCFLERTGELFFGTADGRLCRFNTDREKMDRYNDDGAAITACWTTKADDDGDFMLRKTMLKRGSGVMVKPYTRSSVQVTLRTDADFGVPARYATIDVFDWEDIDFARFAFNSNDAPQVVPFHFKVRKYITIQVIVKNDAVNEGFGVFGIIRRYTRGSYVK